MLSRGSYAMVTDSCTEKKSDSTQIQSSACGHTSTSPELITSFDSIEKGTYLAMLASERAQNDGCALDFIETQITSEADFNVYAEKMQLKVELMAIEARNIIILQNRLAKAAKALPTKRSWSKAELNEFENELQQAKARLASIEYSIPIGDQTTVRNFISQTLEKSLKDFGTTGSMNSESPESILPINSADFKLGLRNALQASKSEIQSDVTILKKGAANNAESLDRATKESLAQDKDLIQSFYERNPNLQPIVAKVSCEVDQEYGRGAEKRDDIILTAGIVTSAISLGWGAVTKAAISGVSLLGTPARILASRGILSLRTSRIIASAASTVALSVNMVGGINTLDKCFQNQQKTKSQLKIQSPNRCENFSAASIAQEDCVLTLALNSLGFAASTPLAQKFVANALGKILPRSSLAVSENAGPMQAWQQGDKVNVPRSAGGTSPGRVTGVTENGSVQVDILDDSGRVIGYKEIASTKLSAQDTLPLRGKGDYDRFANAFNTNNYENGAQYVSVLHNGERRAARVVQSDGRSINVEIMDSQSKPLIKTTISGEGLREVRISETARQVFAEPKIIIGVVNSAPPSLTSRKVSDYTARSGVVVVVDTKSPALKRVVADAERAISNEIPSIAPGNVKTKAQKQELAQAWLNRVVPQIESPDKGKDYADLRNRII